MSSAANTVNTEVDKTDAVRLRQEDFCMFEAKLGYKVNSKPA